MSESKRLKLHEELCSLLGSRNVYFSPPENIKLKYPCIIYNRQRNYIDYANDIKYKSMNNYSLLYIYQDPTSDLVDKIESHFNYCSLDRIYVSNNLYHADFMLYY